MNAELVFWNVDNEEICLIAVKYFSSQQKAEFSELDDANCQHPPAETLTGMVMAPRLGGEGPGGDLALERVQLAVGYQSQSAIHWV